MGEKETQITLADVQRAFEIEVIDYKTKVMNNIIQPLYSLLYDAHKKIKELESEKEKKEVSDANK